MYIPPATIINAVAKVFPVTPEEMTGPGRQSNITDARHCAAYLMHCRRYSNAQIAATFNRGNHSSGAYFHRRAGELYATEAQYRSMVNRVAELLGITLK